MTVEELYYLAREAKTASRWLANLSGEARNEIIISLAKSIRVNNQLILEANALDIARAEANSASAAIIDRLLLTPRRIEECAFALESLCNLPDPLHLELKRIDRPNGLVIRKVSVPFGVVAIIYEGRPNVTLDAIGICLKTGNVPILKGSSSAINSNRALTSIARQALAEKGYSPEAIQFVNQTDREETSTLLKLKEFVDLAIPRGGASLINFVLQNSLVPVLETGAGICHVYIDKDAAIDMSIDIVVNGKTSRPAVCNATETVLVHREWAKKNLSKLVAQLVANGVECRGCKESQENAPTITSLAKEEDWSTEYLDLILSIKVVSSVDEAIQHINRYGTRHSESIVTPDDNNVHRFFSNVDAAAVYHNASTRFTDGGEFGFGAEIGISTQKMHARGPVGLPELTTYKYLIHGTGQTRG